MPDLIYLDDEIRNACGCRWELDSDGVPKGDPVVVCGYHSGLVSDAAKWKTVKRAAEEQNWSEFVPPDVYMAIDRLMTKCCRNLLRECADKSAKILDLENRLSVAIGDRS